MLGCVFAMALTSCDSDDKPTDPELNCDPAEVEVTPGNTAAVTVSGGTAPFTVVSGDDEIVTVQIDESTITVTGVKEGTATVNVTDALQIKGAVTVVVRNAAGLDFDKTSLSMAVGEEETVTVKGGTNPYAAIADDTEVAALTVKDDKITIKAGKAGSTTVTVTDKDKITGKISVTVN